MSVIVNIRGTNSSGKSTAVTQYMRMIGVKQELQAIDGKTWAYLLQNEVYVLGRYETACGGCDTIHTFDGIKGGVALLAERGPVLFEGILWSTVYKASVELARSLPQHHFVFALLDTPLEECLRRVLERRHKAGNDKPFDATKLRAKHATIARCQDRLKAAGFDTRILDHTNPAIEGWFR